MVDDRQALADGPLGRMKNAPLLIARRERIDIWLACYREFSDTAHLASLHALLSDEEKRKLQRFHFADDRLRYLVTRALVRSVLSRYAALAPAQWIFAANPFGRPGIANGIPGAFGLDFNVSHTSGLIAMGISHHRPIGIDIECAKGSRDLCRLADHFFASSECKELSRLPEEQRLLRFFDYWTLKESYIKARGMGLTIPLDKFSFSLAEHNSIALAVDPDLDDTAARWAFWQFQSSGGQVLAVCAGSIPDQATHFTTRKVCALLDGQPIGLELCRSSES